MAGRRQRHLALIIARELASQLATAMFIADAHGDLVFYNEAAEEILGRSFAEAGAMPAEGWGEQFRIRAPDGEPLPLEKMPMGIAMTERRPAHGNLRIVGLDGVSRLLSVTALPLFSKPTELVGTVALFWEEREPGGGMQERG